MTRFDECMEFILNREGRTDKQDSKDVNTSYGVTQPTYDSWRDSKALPRQNVDDADPRELRELYHERYWLAGKCDQMPAPIDLIHFDTRVNNGEGTADRMLQTALSMSMIDGVIGERTLAAIRLMDPLVLATRYVGLRLTRYIVISAGNDKRRYLKGWLRRVGHLLVAI